MCVLGTYRELLEAPRPEARASRCCQGCSWVAPFRPVSAVTLNEPEKRRRVFCLIWCHPSGQGGDGAQPDGLLQGRSFEV